MDEVKNFVHQNHQEEEIHEDFLGQMLD